MDETPNPMLPQAFKLDTHHDRYKRVMDAVRSDLTGYLGVVIAAAYIEVYLRSALERRLPHADRFLKDGSGNDLHYDFQFILRLAYSLGDVDEHVYELFKAFARLRNQFAHSPDEFIYKPEHKELLRRIFVVWHPTEQTNVLLRDAALKDFDKLEGPGLFAAFEYIVGILAAYAFNVHVHAQQPKLTGSTFLEALAEATDAGKKSRGE